MKIKTLIYALSSLLLIGCADAEDKKDTADTKKIIFLTGDDTRHASGTHEFYAGGLLLEKSLKASQFSEQLEIEVVNNWPDDTSVFEGADVIVHYYGGNRWHPVNTHHEFLNELSLKGVSQMFMHYAVDPNEEAESAIQSWTGGVYKDDLSTNPHWLLKANLENHPINSGVAAYESYDEWYSCIQFEEEPEIGYEKPCTSCKVHSVMSGSPEDFLKSKRIKPKFKRQLSTKELTVLWAKQREDGGRGVGLTGGHYHKNWANDEFRKQVLNAIIWCAKIPVPDSGVESPEITEKAINENLDDRKKGGLKKITLP